MTQVVDHISEATGTSFSYRAVSLKEKRRQLATAGLPADALDLLDELFNERARCTKSYVDVSTYKTFGVEPTSFAQFARRHAGEFLPGQAANAS